MYYKKHGPSGVYTKAAKGFLPITQYFMKQPLQTEVTELSSDEKEEEGLTEELEESEESEKSVNEHGDNDNDFTKKNENS